MEMKIDHRAIQYKWYKEIKTKEPSATTKFQYIFFTSPSLKNGNRMVKSQLQ